MGWGCRRSCFESSSDLPGAPHWGACDCVVRVCEANLGRLIYGVCQNRAQAAVPNFYIDIEPVIKMMAKMKVSHDLHI